MEEEAIKLALAFGNYTSQEINQLRSSYPITHTESGQMIMDERLYILALSGDQTLGAFSEVLLCNKEDLPLLINSKLYGAAKQV